MKSYCIRWGQVGKPMGEWQVMSPQGDESLTDLIKRQLSGLPMAIHVEAFEVGKIFTFRVTPSVLIQPGVDNGPV